MISRSNRVQSTGRAHIDSVSCLSTLILPGILAIVLVVILIKDLFLCMIFRDKEMIGRRDYLFISTAKVSRLLVDLAGTKQISKPAPPP